MLNVSEIIFGLLVSLVAFIVYFYLNNLNQDNSPFSRDVKCQKQMIGVNVTASKHSIQFVTSSLPII